MSEDLESSDWMAVDPPLGSIAPLGPLIDDIEALGTGNLCFSFRKSLLTAIFDDHQYLPQVLMILKFLVDQKIVKKRLERRTL